MIYEVRRQNDVNIKIYVHTRSHKAMALDHQSVGAGGRLPVAVLQGYSVKCTVTRNEYDTISPHNYCQLQGYIIEVEPSKLT